MEEAAGGTLTLTLSLRQGRGERRVGVAPAAGIGGHRPPQQGRQIDGGAGVC